MIPCMFQRRQLYKDRKYLSHCQGPKDVKEITGTHCLMGMGFLAKVKKMFWNGSDNYTTLSMYLKLLNYVL